MGKDQQLDRAAVHDTFPLMGCLVQWSRGNFGSKGASYQVWIESAYWLDITSVTFLRLARPVADEGNSYV